MEDQIAIRNVNPFRTKILSQLLTTLKTHSEVDAVWEAGSAATGTSDEYSDLDLVVLSSGDSNAIFEKIEESLEAVARITHKYNEPPGIYKNYDQRMFFLDGAPKHFFLDIGVLSVEAKPTLKELLKAERHGTPVVHFDKTGAIQTTATDLTALKQEHQKRVADTKAAFPIIVTEVLKELDRGHHVDAFVFYFALVKRFVELLGIKYRPWRYDFGLRYASRDFPFDVHKRLNNYVFVSDANKLRALTLELEEEFSDTLKFVENSFETAM
jgi:predicted nucleotidyltransferase